MLILIPILIHIAITTPITTPISINIHIHITAPALALSNILTSVPLQRAPVRPHLGIPPHPSLLAGSCHQLHRHREPTSIKGLLHVAL
ncbi:hypothetical protein CesoFtcFv8_021057 [Champsocephalus esox]|uniref:Uncharacterized protein n=1 Tax=Champsocephalus esox TaxID=159716 RepID=A0AAN8GMC9_9TELE|nr:hypothetical protein CesoFtcFv8_021057 [Champsocephalus esox]